MSFKWEMNSIRLTQFSISHCPFEILAVTAMNTIYLMRHSLTVANEKRLYGGSTDSPLTEKGVAIAAGRRGVIPECDLYVTSGMRRANETLYHMTGRHPGLVLAGLREMDFGAFEMRSYDELKDIPEYILWIGDETGDVYCPGGESRSGFRARVLKAGERLLAMDADRACVVCHGGAIVSLMEAWFPDIHRLFYEWQPGACGGYKIIVQGGRPAGFEEV